MENHFNCIYCYTNTVNGKRYVGQTKDFNRRHKQHIKQSHNKNNKYNYNYPFHCAIRKYGIENFKVEILKENLSAQCLLNFWECYYIDKYNSLAKNKKGYNVASGGSNGNVFEGKTEEEMNKTKAKMSEAKTGKTHSEETKVKMSEAKKGKCCGENNPMYGKHHSEETKAKISKKIAQYTKDNVLIIVYPSSHEAERQTGVSHGNIITCCQFHSINCNREKWFKTHKNRPHKSAGGYIWKYYEE